MGIRVRFHKGARWIFIRHNNKRKAKKVGDKAAALRLKRDLEERLAREDFDEKWRGYGGSIKSISVEGDALR